MQSRSDADVVDLSSFDAEFERAATQLPTEAPLDEIPDGFYDVRIEDVSLNKTLNTGNPMVIWKLRILGPQCQGRSLTKVRVVTSKTLPYLKEDLVRLGLELSRLSELSTRKEEMLEREIGVFKRTQPDRRWTDVYFVRKRRGPSAEAGAESLWRTGTDDDLPF